MKISLGPHCEYIRLRCCEINSNAYDDHVTSGEVSTWQKKIWRPPVTLSSESRYTGEVRKCLINFHRTLYRASYDVKASIN
jgi:hypothetical protein